MITYRLSGRVVDRQSRQGLPDIRIEAWDSSAKTSDLIAFGKSDAEGAFAINIDQAAIERHFHGTLPVLDLHSFSDTQDVTGHVYQWKVSKAPATLQIEVNVDNPTSPRAPALSVVRGTVRTPDGPPPVETVVRLLDDSLVGSTMMAEGTTDSEGRYVIEYAGPALPGKVHPDLRVVVLAEDEDVIASSPRFCRASATMVVDVVVGDYRGLSELTKLETSLGVHAAGVDLGYLSDEQIDQLVCGSGADRAQVTARVKAADVLNELSETAPSTTLQVPEVYALLRQGVPRYGLALTPPSDLRRALNAAIEDKSFDGTAESVEGHMTALRQTAIDLAFYRQPETNQPNIGDILAKALPSRAVSEEFLDSYLSHTGSSEQFWTNLAWLPSFEGAGVIPDLQFALQLGALTRYHRPLLDELWDRKIANQISSLEDLAAYSESDWINLLAVTRSSVPIGAPNDTPGANTTEKRAAYAKVMKRALEAAFPTTAIAGAIAALGADELTTFFDNNASFAFGKTRVGAYLASNAGALAGITDQAAVTLRLHAIERLFKVTPRFDEMKPLLDGGLTSSRAIVRMGRTRFIGQYSAQVGGAAVAANIYDNAAGAAHHALALHLKLGNLFNAKSAYAIPDVVTRAGTPPEELATYTALFGSPDACACDHCVSVYGPAAYLVDVLHFLDRYDSKVTKSGSVKWSAKDVLLGSAPAATPVLAGRRPDIGHIDLTCDNADTSLPYVDLVNEILAYAVVSITDEAPALPDHIANSGTAEELAAVPNPPGAESDWFVSAYDTLASSVYPWATPYHAKMAEARVYLDHLGVPRGELMWALRPTSADSDDLAAIAAERLGLSPFERQVITGAAGLTTAPAWGLTIGASLTPLLGVPALLARSGLSYDELCALVDTAVLARFGTPSLAPAGSCKIEEQTLTGLTSVSGALEMIHRFVRLQRRLGWSIGELDQVLAACAPTGTNLLNDKALRVIAVIASVRASLGAPIPVLASWFGPLDTQRRDGGATPSFYEQLFQNKAVANPVDSALALPGVTSLMSDALLESHTPAVLAGLRMSKVELSLLTEDTEPGLEETKPPVRVPPSASVPALTSLAALHRIITFSRAARLSLSEFLALYNLSDQAPFDASNPERTLGFLEMVARIRRSGLSTADLEYLFRYRVSPQASTALTDTAANPVLDELFTALLALRNKNGAVDEAAEAALIEDKLASALKLELRCVHLLTSDLLTAGSPAAPLGDAFLLPDVLPDVPTPSLDSFALRAGQLEAYVYLHRIATLVRRLELRADEIEALFGSSGPSLLDLDDLPRARVSGTGSTSFAAWQALVQLAALRSSLAGSDRTLVRLLATDSAELATATGWPKADIDALLDSFPLGTESTQIANLLRLRDALAAVKRLGVSAATALDWSDPASVAPERSADVVADGVLRAAKAKYDGAAWARVAPPLRDVLREQLRAAMVAYVVTKKGYQSSDELFADLLVDVETSPAVLTSRIKQAIGSVQTFIQRAFLNLEADTVTLPEEAAREWAWRRSYRVWEANRKVFIHPETYLDPSLRDDKSPFFKDLEAELRQKDITDEAAEIALERYLDKLDDVGNLDVAAMFHQQEEGDDTHVPIDLLHVVGRTRLKPHKYFYRTRVDGAVWTPWEAVDLDIEADQLLLTVENRRPHLFWPILEEKPDSTQDIPDSTDEPGSAATTRWEIRLAWSERRSGKWTARRISDGVPVTLSSTLTPAPAVLVSLVLDRGSSDDSPRIAILANIFNISFRLGYFSRNGCGVLEGTDFRVLLPDQFDSLEQLRLALPVGTIWRWHDGVLPDGSTTQELVVPVAINGAPRQLTLFGHVGASFHTLSPHALSNDDDDASAGASFFYKDERASFFAEVVRFAHTDWYEGSRAMPATLPFNGVEGNALLLGRGDITPLVASWAKTVPPTTYFPHVWEDAKRYRFTPFYHPYVCLFREELQRSGVDGLLKWSLHQGYPLQLRHEDIFTEYEPDPDNVLAPYPLADVDFSFRGAYSLYNWELFFHAPFLIAQRLMQNGRHAEAQRWFHFIFDPATGDPAPSPQRFWKVKPLRENIDLTSVEDELRSPEEPQSLATVLIKAILNIDDDSDPVKDDFAAQIDAWQKQPFNPHLIARMRPVAYQKAVVVKYIENLMAWADQLFRRDTIEAINEAIQLYILAAGMLGRRGLTIRPRQGQAPKNYWELEQLGLGDFSDPVVAAASRVAAESLAGKTRLTTAWHPAHEPPPDLGTLYFCVPGDDSITMLWDIVSDRLFKIRHSMNIEGVFRQLPLFEPPIDPMLLVQATALGVDLATALADLNAAPLPYRFNVVHAKAMELSGAVAGLGSSLLAAMEKKDAEALSRLRSGQELDLLSAVREVKSQQVKEAAATVTAMQRSLESATLRRDHYAGLPRISAGEAASLAMTTLGIELGFVAQAIAAVAPPVEAIPPITFGASGAWGSPVFTTTIGGQASGAPIEAASQALSMVGSLLRDSASVVATVAGYERRAEEWALQEQLAAKEMQQIEKQIAAAKIRVAIAEVELRNHDLQVEQARGVFEFLRDKRTSEALYDWMVDQLATVHYQAYTLAYDMAQRAERALRFEVGTPEDKPALVTFGYWDNLKDGLLAGERLLHDLRRLDVTFLEQTPRELELVRHVSLAEVAPDKLMELRENGVCEVALGEDVFDRDYPGHCFRRIKSVALTFPTVTGAYAGVSCTLTLSGTSIRKHQPVSGSYDDEANFRTNLVPITDTIVTSSGVNDAGLFETNLRDERYLPFEGAGVIGTYKIEMPAATNRFDISSIDDVILHIHYTARADGGVTTAAKTYYTTNPRVERRLFSLRSELPGEWELFMTPPADPGDAQVLSIPLTPSMFPYAPATKETVLKKATLYTRWNGKALYSSGGALAVSTTLPGGSSFTLPAMGASGNTGVSIPLSLSDVSLGTFTLSVASTDVAAIASALRTANRLDGTLQDIYLLCEYGYVNA